MLVEDIPLIAGHPALDFVNTVEGRGTDELVNYLGDFQSLLGWCVRAGVLDARPAKRIEARAADVPAKAKHAWAEAMALRDALNAVFRALANGRQPKPAPLETLNGMLSRASASQVLERATDHRMAWTWADPERDALRIPAWSIALAAADLVTGEMPRPIKICLNGPCDWLFLDTSKNGRRRWCRMSVCGNASKVRRYRERHRHEGVPA